MHPEVSGATCPLYCPHAHPPRQAGPWGASGRITSIERKAVMPVLFQSPALPWPLAVC